MIYGIGTDITEVKRFVKWVEKGEMITRFFNPKEMNQAKSVQAASEHYAARFAAKEAFGKALGTGIFGFDLKDIYIVNDENGKPELIVENAARNELEKRCVNPKIHISLSHEKEYAIAYVIIESL